VAREYYPNHQLKREGTYENGSLVGVAHGYHLDGQLQSVRYYEKAGAQPAVTIEFNSNGKPTELRCGAKPLVPEDKPLCGWDGKRTDVVLYSNHDEQRERLTMLNGKPLVAQGFDKSGKVTESSEATANGRIDRRFHPNGQVASESVVANDYRVSETEWYMNGSVKTRTTREPVERQGKSTAEHYRDTGVIESRDQYRGNTRTSGQRYDDAGKLSEEFTYDEEGTARTHRKFAPDGSVTLDEEFYPDGSRKVKTPGPKISAPEK
jgi:YD repeat-containing protein